MARVALQTCSSSAAGQLGSPPPCPPRARAFAWRWPRRRRSRANNSSKAGRIQAPLGEDDSPEIHAEDVVRSSHDTADPDLVEVLTSEASPRSPGSRSWLCVHPGERRLPPGPLRRSSPAAPAPGGRPNRPCDHQGAARGVQLGRRHARPPPSGRARADRERLARVLHDPRRPRRGRGGDRRARVRRALLRRGRDARRELSTNHPNATGETTRSRSTPGRSA